MAALFVAYSVLDLAIGSRHSPTSTLLVSNAVGLPLSLLFVWLAWRRLWWAWALGVVVAVIGTTTALVAIFVPFVVDYDDSTPKSFLLVQFLLLASAAALWLLPPVRPSRSPGREGR